MIDFLKNRGLNLYVEKNKQTYHQLHGRQHDVKGKHFFEATVFLRWSLDLI